MENKKLNLSNIGTVGYNLLLEENLVFLLIEEK